MYVAIEYGERLLKGEFNRQQMMDVAASAPRYIRFDRRTSSAEELVVPEDRWSNHSRRQEIVSLELCEWEWPICGLQLSSESVHRSTCVASLGTAAAEMEIDDSILVPTSQIDELLGRCRRPVIRFRDHMPPRYIFRHWLEAQVAEYRFAERKRSSAVSTKGVAASQ